MVILVAIVVNAASAAVETPCAVMALATVDLPSLTDFKQLFKLRFSVLEIKTFYKNVPQRGGHLFSYMVIIGCNKRKEDLRWNLSYQH